MASIASHSQDKFALGSGVGRAQPRSASSRLRRLYCLFICTHSFVFIQLRVCVWCGYVQLSEGASGVWKRISDHLAMALQPVVSPPPPNLGAGKKRLQSSVRAVCAPNY